MSNGTHADKLVQGVDDGLYDWEALARVLLTWASDADLENLIEEDPDEMFQPEFSE